MISTFTSTITSKTRSTSAPRVRNSIQSNNIAPPIPASNSSYNTNNVSMSRLLRPTAASLRHAYKSRDTEVNSQLEKETSSSSTTTAPNSSLPLPPTYEELMNESSNEEPCVVNVQDEEKNRKKKIELYRQQAMERVKKQKQEEMDKIKKLIEEREEEELNKVKQEYNEKKEFNKYKSAKMLALKEESKKNNEKADQLRRIQLITRFGVSPWKKFVLIVR